MCRRDAVPLNTESDREQDMVSSMRWNSKIDRKRDIRGASIVALLAVAWLTFSTAIFAQNQDKVKAGLHLWRGSGCADCHGAFANGEKERDEAPTGADLRQARLDAAALKLAISCGRPGVGMPAFEQDAGLCAGKAVGDYPAPRTLNSDEIDAVVAYLQARILGKGSRITKQECLLYYYDKPDWCEYYN
jgi:mono/diheme cytochrome c family protein